MIFHRKGILAIEVMLSHRCNKHCRNYEERYNMLSIFILFCLLLFLPVTLFPGGTVTQVPCCLSPASKCPPKVPPPGFLPLVSPSFREPGLTWESHGFLPPCRCNGGWPLRLGLNRHCSPLLVLRGRPPSSDPSHRSLTQAPYCQLPGHFNECYFPSVYPGLGFEVTSAREHWVSVQLLHS